MMCAMWRRSGLNRLSKDGPAMWQFGASRRGVGHMAAALVLALAGACSAGGGTDLIATVGENLPATGNVAVSPIASNSPMLAVDPTEPRFVVMANRIDAYDFDCALQVSGDGGKTFGPVNVVP